MVRAWNNQHRDNNDIQTKSSRRTDDDINDWAKRNKRRLGDFWITCREMRQSKSYDNFRTSCNETPRRSGVVLMGFRSRRLPKRPERPRFIGRRRLGVESPVRTLSNFGIRSSPRLVGAQEAGASVSPSINFQYSSLLIGQLARSRAWRMVTPICRGM